MRSVWPAVLGLTLVSFGHNFVASAESLPEGFVFLSDVEPTIVQEIRYAGYHNFLGRPAAGYESAQCILAKPAALALKRVQDQIAPKGFSLKVYDCYRPVRAVKDFLSWAQDPADTKTKAEFYPHQDKSRLFALGYLAKQSSHSKGNTVDLTIVPTGLKQPTYRNDETQKACHLPAKQRFPDSSLDFGTGFDCFHELSRTGNAAISPEAKSNRRWLVELMGTAGFRNYAKEWWHFELAAFGTLTVQDFPITARAPVERNLETQGHRDRPQSVLPLSCGVENEGAVASLVVCLGTALSATVYEEPDDTSKELVSLGQDTLVTCLRCSNGLVGARHYWSLDKVERKDSSAPWCLVEVFASGAARRRGWVSAKYLAPKGGLGTCITN